VSRFVVVPDGSRLSALARSSLHPFSYRAPLLGEIEASVRDGAFDVTAPITGALQVDLDDLRGDDPRTDSELHRRLDTQRFPRARAAVQEVTPSGGDAYRLIGELTLRGQTRPLAGDATLTLDGDELHAVGSLTIDLRDFGIKPPSLLILRVHPEIEIAIDLVATLDGNC
jgi:polyisoprenoid-binding protein YceI